jgi:hypothetical protein
MPLLPTLWLCLFVFFLFHVADSTDRYPIGQSVKQIYKVLQFPCDKCYVMWLCTMQWRPFTLKIASSTHWIEKCHNQTECNGEEKVLPIPRTVSQSFDLPYFPVDNARVIYKKNVKIRKRNEHARYTLECFPVDNACYLPENIQMYTAHVHFLTNFDLFLYR